MIREGEGKRRRSIEKTEIKRESRTIGGGGGGGVYLESYTREARFLTRWDQHAVALRRP